MKKVILLTSFLLLAVLAAALLYFSGLSSGGRSNDKVLAIIPQDASLVLEFSNDKSFYDIFNDYKLFDTITGNQKKAELETLKNLLLRNSNLTELTVGQNVFLSFHPGKSGLISFLWLMPLRQKLSAELLRPAIKSGNDVSVKETNINGIPVYEIQLVNLKKTFYLYADKNKAAGSFSRDLLARSLNKNTAKIAKDFAVKINSADMQNQNSLLNLFINYQTSPVLWSAFLRGKLDGNFLFLKTLKGFSSLNMNFKSDALMFNGITYTDTLTENYLNLFTGQKPATNSIKSIVPENTANYMVFALSDFNKFQTGLKALFLKRKELDKLNEQIKGIAKENGIDPERDIKKLFGKEFITFQLSSHEKLGAMRVSNGRQMQFVLEPLSSEYSVTIRKLNESNLLYFYFGDPFKSFVRPFFTVVDNQLVVSNSPGTLQRFLNAYNAEKLLYKTQRFIEFDQFVANQSNVSLFIHNNNSTSILRSGLKKQYADNFKSEDYGLKDIYGLSYQWSSADGHFFTNLYISLKKDLPAVDEASLLNIADTTAVPQEVQ